MIQPAPTVHLGHDEGALLFDRLQGVAFSCKRRGFCLSCMGRRMADTAAFCIDHLFPKVPVRQFVLTVPMRLRFRMAASPQLTSAILRCFIAAVTSDLRRRARRLGFSGDLQTGAVTVVQRFGSSLALKDLGSQKFETCLAGRNTSRNRCAIDAAAIPFPGFEHLNFQLNFELPRQCRGGKV